MDFRHVTNGDPSDENDGPVAINDRFYFLRIQLFFRSLFLPLLSLPRLLALTLTYSNMTDRSGRLTYR